MDKITAFSIILLAALIHASFQLSVSLLTLLSAKTLGNKNPHKKVVKLNFGFLLGSGVMTVLSISFVAFLIQNIFNQKIPYWFWIFACAYLLAIGVGVWAFYYKKSDGTELWIPRSIANYLSERTKNTDKSFEAFMLGGATVFGEVIFILAPILVSSASMLFLPDYLKIIAIFAYAIISLLPLLFISFLVGGGHKLSVIQKWREKNKKFLQFMSGSALIILSLYIYVFIVVDLAATRF